MCCYIFICHSKEHLFLIKEMQAVGNLFVVKRKLETVPEGAAESPLPIVVVLLSHFPYSLISRLFPATLGKAHTVRGADAEIHPFTRVHTRYQSHQLHLSSGSNEVGFKWCLYLILALHIRVKFIVSDFRGKRSWLCTQSGLPVKRTHAGTVSSLALEPGCCMSQEHHEHDVQVVSDPLTSAHGTQHANRTPGWVMWVSEDLSQSLHFLLQAELT